MSYHLGISHSPVLHRHFSSPLSEGFPDPSSDEDLTQDSKDVLIDRLNDLVARLSKVPALKDRTVSSIHSEVDKIELLLGGAEKVYSPRHSRQTSSHSNAQYETEPFSGPPNPTQSMKMRFPPMPWTSPSPRPVPERQPMTPEKALEIAKNAQDLVLKLSATLKELQLRKEESDHVHDLLIVRCEAAAQRIILLQYRGSEMVDDFESNQSELKYLRIQLQAIQAQYSHYVRGNEDAELAKSISNWKVDWEDIDRKSKARRKKCRDSLTPDTSDIPTLVNGA